MDIQAIKAKYMADEDLYTLRQKVKNAKGKELKTLAERNIKATNSASYEKIMKKLNERASNQYGHSEDYKQRDRELNDFRNFLSKVTSLVRNFTTELKNSNVENYLIELEKAVAKGQKVYDVARKALNA